MSEIGLERAFMLMLGCITAADASRRQVNGILSWRDQVRRALNRAREAGSAQGTQVPAVPSTTHRAWLEASGDIIAALGTQARAAERLRHERESAAAAQDARAAEADTEAARADAAAAHAEALATDEARKEEPQTAIIAAYRAQAAGAREAAQCARDRATGARDRAVALRAQAEAAAVWQIAALEAASAGRSLTASEDAIAQPVGAAIRAAGGAREVPADKHYLTGSHPLAFGGAR